MSNNVLRRSFGVIHCNKKKAFDGYTLFAPMWGRQALLLDMDGNIVHRWKFNKRPGDFTILLPNGNLAYPERLPPVRLLFVGGVGCDFLEVDWKNNLVWKYTEPDNHHAQRRLQNGNTLFVFILKLPNDYASRIKGGRPGTEKQGAIYADGFREIDPQGKVVWEWKSYEHLDPHLFPICPLEDRMDWLHTNTLFEMPSGDILTCWRSVDSLAIIDRRSGELKWHWGRGELKHPHMATYLDNGNVLCYDNGPHRENCLFDYSRVIEVDPRTNTISWEYIDQDPTQFYSIVISGAYRLPNGNTLITEGCKGRIFEVTKEKEIVWEYVSPYFYETGIEYLPGLHNWVHRAYRYPGGYSGLTGRNLDPNSYKELNLIYGSGAF